MLFRMPGRSDRTRIASQFPRMLRRGVRTDGSSGETVHCRFRLALVRLAVWVARPISSYERAHREAVLDGRQSASPRTLDRVGSACNWHTAVACRVFLRDGCQGSLPDRFRFLRILLANCSHRRIESGYGEQVDANRCVLSCPSQLLLERVGGHVPSTPL